MRDRATLLFQNTADIIREYERGFVGVYKDPAADARLAQGIEDAGGYSYGGMACSASGLDGTGQGRLLVPFTAALRLYPGCLPAGQQLRGDCVSWSSRTAALVSYCASLVYGPNDRRNAAPTLTREGIENGVFSTESWYWNRGYDGDGWTCTAAADVGMRSAGLVLRQNYPELDVDLTTYSPKKAGKYGKAPPPEEVRRMTSQYLILNATVCDKWEQVRDMLANGYALSTCGAEAWADKRDDNGVCNRTSGTWYHAIAAVAADDRPETIKKYGCGLVLFQNSWGEYMTGSRRVMGTDIEIPEGAFWSRWDDCHDRTFIAFGTGKGWKPQPLPDWGLGGVI